MLKRIKQAIERRRERARRRKWVAGYDWACGLLMRGDMTPAGVWAYCVSFVGYLQNSDFDAGARCAIRHAIQAGVTDDDRPYGCK